MGVLQRSVSSEETACKQLKETKIQLTTSGEKKKERLVSEKDEGIRGAKEKKIRIQKQEGLKIAECH